MLPGAGGVQYSSQDVKPSKLLEHTGVSPPRREVLLVLLVLLVVLQQY